MGKITQFEQVFLKWFDLNHLLKIKYHMLDICAANERDSVLLDWLHLAELFTMQTEALGLRGTLRYLQDTSATHISNFGVMVYNVSERCEIAASDARARARPGGSAARSRWSAPLRRGTLTHSSSPASRTSSAASSRAT